MSGFDYIIKLTVLNGGAFAKLASMAKGFDNSLDQVQGEVDQTAYKLSKMGQRGASAFDSMRSSLKNWLVGLGLATAALGSLTTTADVSSLDTAITFAGGAQGAANLAYVEQTAARLNTPIMAAKEGFKTLTGSMIGTNITALQQRDIFDSVAVASRVMGLSADNTTGAILALGQMASKGKVQAEELRGQLGERIPGAFGIAARAMGVTTAELNKMMEQGQVIAEDFLPKFAAEMQRTFGPGLEAAMKTPRAQFDKFGNSILNLKELIGTQLMPTAIALINDVFIPMVSWIGHNIDALKFLGVAVGGVWAAYKFYSVWAGIAAFATGGFTTAVEALTLAMSLNPIGLIIAAVIAVGAAVVYAWNEFEGFRSGIYAFWQVAKTVATFLYDVFTWNIKMATAAFEGLLEVLKPINDFIISSFSFNLRMTGDAMKWVWENTVAFRKVFSDLIGDIINGADMLWEKLIKPFSIYGQIVSVIAPLFGNAGEAVGQSFSDGWNKGLSDFRGYDVTAPIADDRWDYYNQRRMDALGDTTFSQPPAGGAPQAPNSQASQLSNSITSGGQRNTTIIINKLTGVETIHTTNLKESANAVGDALIKEMLQVVNSGNQQQGK